MNEKKEIFSFFPWFGKNVFNLIVLGSVFLIFSYFSIEMY
jgi:hypothetical protein